MKILLCGRRKENLKMVEVASKLQRAGHNVNMGSLSLDNKQSPPFEQTKEFKNLKAKNMSNHFEEIENCDAIFVCNFNGYIGMNTFAEIMFAWYHGCYIFLLEEYDEKAAFAEELYTIEPIVIDNVNKIKNCKR